MYIDTIAISAILHFRIIQCYFFFFNVFFPIKDDWSSCDSKQNLCLRAKESEIRAASLKREVTCTLLQHKQFSDTSSDTYLHAKTHERLLWCQSRLFFDHICSSPEFLPRPLFQQPQFTLWILQNSLRSDIGTLKNMNISNTFFTISSKDPFFFF